MSDRCPECGVSPEEYHVILGEVLAKNTALQAAADSMAEALASIENDSGHIPEAIWKLRNYALAAYKKVRGDAP